MSFVRFLLGWTWGLKPTWGVVTAMEGNTNLVRDLLHVRVFRIFLPRSVCAFRDSVHGRILTGRLAGLAESPSSREIVRFTCCAARSLSSNSAVSESSFSVVCNVRLACRRFVTAEWSWTPSKNIQLSVFSKYIKVPELCFPCPDGGLFQKVSSCLSSLELPTCGCNRLRSAL